MHSTQAGFEATTLNFVIKIHNPRPEIFNTPAVSHAFLSYGTFTKTYFLIHGSMQMGSESAHKKAKIQILLPFTPLRT